MTEPLAMLARQYDEVPAELIETVDYVLSDPRGTLYVDGSLLLTNAEVWERRKGTR